MIVPVGQRYQQMLYLFEKKDGQLDKLALLPTLFVPMTGAAEDGRLIKPDPAHPSIHNGGFEEFTTRRRRADKACRTRPRQRPRNRGQSRRLKAASVRLALPAADEVRRSRPTPPRVALCHVLKHRARPQCPGACRAWPSTAARFTSWKSRCGSKGPTSSRALRLPTGHRGHHLLRRKPLRNRLPLFASLDRDVSLAAGRREGARAAVGPAKPWCASV